MIETERLILRDWHLEDADDLYRYASDNRVSELALWPAHSSVDMSRDVIKEFFIPNKFCFAIVLKETGRLVGCIGLVPQGMEHYSCGSDTREVGYWIGYPYWGNGMTTEALSEVIALCRSIPEIRSLIITTDMRNIASQRVAEKCGFKIIKEYLFEDIPSMLFQLDL